MSNDFSGDLFRDVDSLKAQLIQDDGTLSIYSKDSEIVPVTCLRVRISSIAHGHDFVVGHPINSKIGVPALGIDGQQISIGTAGIGATTVLQVKNLNNLYEEDLRTSDFVDSANTTATVDTTNFKVTF